MFYSWFIRYEVKASSTRRRCWRPRQQDWDVVALDVMAIPAPPTDSWKHGKWRICCLTALQQQQKCWPSDCASVIFLPATATPSKCWLKWTRTNYDDSVLVFQEKKKEEAADHDEGRHLALTQSRQLAASFLQSLRASPSARKRSSYNDVSLAEIGPNLPGTVWATGFGAPLYSAARLLLRHLRALSQLSCFVHSFPHVSRVLSILASSRMCWMKGSSYSSRSVATYSLSSCFYANGQSERTYLKVWWYFG